MTRSSPAWLWIAFFVALVGVGFRYWQLPAAQAALPGSLYGPGLVAVAVVALMPRAFGLARFWKVWLLIAASVPLAVLVRIILETARDPASHQRWPLELGIALALGLGWAVLGTGLGSLLLLRSSRRPQ
jgi:hypothetical protein